MGDGYYPKNIPEQLLQQLGCKMSQWLPVIPEPGLKLCCIAGFKAVPRLAADKDHHKNKQHRRMAHVHTVH